MTLFSVWNLYVVQITFARTLHQKKHFDALKGNSCRYNLC